MPLLTAVAGGENMIVDYVRLPAHAFGLYPRKGDLVPCADADHALVDLKASSHIDRAMLHSVCARVTPFHGHALTGVPRHTLMRSRFVMREREGNRSNVSSRCPSHSHVTPSTRPQQFSSGQTDRPASCSVGLCDDHLDLQPPTIWLVLLYGDQRHTSAAAAKINCR